MTVHAIYFQKMLFEMNDPSSLYLYINILDIEASLEINETNTPLLHVSLLLVLTTLEYIPYHLSHRIGSCSVYPAEIHPYACNSLH